MVDKKTGVKPKKVASSKQKVASGKPKAAKKNEVKVEPDVVEATAITEIAKHEVKSIPKAGKHSAKAIAEAEAEQVRQERIKAG
ncbi:MAG: hypothetical protein AAB896_00820, partial [Patescibacteria group bacterium]